MFIGEGSSRGFVSAVHLGGVIVMVWWSIPLPCDGVTPVQLGM